MSLSALRMAPFIALLGLGVALGAGCEHDEPEPLDDEAARTLVQQQRQSAQTLADQRREEVVDSLDEAQQRIDDAIDEADGVIEQDLELHP